MLAILSRFSAWLDQLIDPAPQSPWFGDRTAPPKPAPRKSVRKITAGQLLLPEYADTREGILLRALMRGQIMTMDDLAFELRNAGHKVFVVHKDVSNVRACLRRSCIEMKQGKAVRANGRAYVLLALSDNQRRALSEEAARWGAWDGKDRRSRPRGGDLPVDCRACGCAQVSECPAKAEGCPMNGEGAQ
ncbi:hypothetical protein [Methylobacterium sp. Gmos1]